jgi:hypothetical protein
MVVHATRGRHVVRHLTGFELIDHFAEVVAGVVAKLLAHPAGPAGDTARIVLVHVRERRVVREIVHPTLFGLEHRHSRDEPGDVSRAAMLAPRLGALSSGERLIVEARTTPTGVTTILVDRHTEIVDRSRAAATNGCATNQRSPGAPPLDAPGLRSMYYAGLMPRILCRSLARTSGPNRDSETVDNSRCRLDLLEQARRPTSWAGIGPLRAQVDDTTQQGQA